MKLQEAQGDFIDKTLNTDYDDDGQFQKYMTTSTLVCFSVNNFMTGK